MFSVSTLVVPADIISDSTTYCMALAQSENSMLASEQVVIPSSSPYPQNSWQLERHRDGMPAGRLRIVLENQGLLGIAFFEASAFVILLVLFSLFRRDQHGSYFRFWLAGWCCFTFSAVFEVMFLARPLGGFHLASLVTHTAALLLFL